MQMSKCLKYFVHCKVSSSFAHPLLRIYKNVVTILLYLFLRLWNSKYILVPVKGFLCVLKIIRHLNSINPYIKFTTLYKNNGQITFLNTLATREPGRTTANTNRFATFNCTMASNANPVSESDKLIKSSVF